MPRDVVGGGGHGGGIDLVRASAEPFRCGRAAHDHRLAAPASRWTPGGLPHARLRAALAREDDAYACFLDALEDCVPVLHAVPHEASVAGSATPYWNNAWFTALDAAALMTMLAWRKPARYVEIGSGTSTCFARYTVDALSLPTTVISIDPMPRRQVDALCDQMVRCPLEVCDLRLFDALKPGDIVFFDASNRPSARSDVAVFVFEVLPRLAPGVIVQIQGVRIPDEDLSAGDRRHEGAQYLLAAMLMCGRPPFRTIAPVAYLCGDAATAARVRRVFAARGPGPDIPFRYPNDPGPPGASFWCEMTCERV